MKKKMKMAMAVIALCVAILTLTQPFCVFAVIDLPDDEGYGHLVFGGHMLDWDGERHPLDPVNCYIDFSLDENRVLWLAINSAVEDWDWHLSYISRYTSLQNGYETDQYNFGMACNEVYRAQSDIFIEYTTDYIRAGYQPTSAYAITDYSMNLDGESVRNDVGSGYNWRYAKITISQKKFDNYLLDHTEEETKALMKKVVNHELGHALGLAHDSRDNGIIMYGNGEHELCDGHIYDSDTMTATVPTLHDLISVCLLYT